ncbi:polynucleotide adenylyltransferase [Globodera pallida]|nr:polynucleotide adenylyltransferase [Globodera pallida]
MELSMDSMSVKHCEEEIENLKSYMIKLFKYAINCLLPNDHSPIDEHVKILGELLASGEFSNQLKEIYVDEQRINILLGPDESLKIEMLSKAKSHGGEKATLEERSSKTMAESSNAHKKPWEAEPDFDEANELIDVYQKMLLSAEKISDSANHSHIVNVAHFQFKLWIKRILQFIDSLKDKNRPKFTRTAIYLGIEATKMGFFSLEQLKNKEENICLMMGFLGHLTGNGILRENEKWATFIDAFIKETEFLNIIYENVTLEKYKNDWVKPKCSERRISNSVMLYLKKARTQEQMHMRVIHMLFLKFPDFLKTVALNELNFTKISEFNEIIGEKELLNFYKRHLEPDNHNDDSFDENKIAVLLKFLTTIAFRDEQALSDWIELGQNLLTTSVGPKCHKDVKLMTSKVSINDHLTTTIRDNLGAKAELGAMLKIQEIFAEKFPTARMLCPLLHYIDYLEKTLDNSNQRWQIPFKCFKMEIGEINKNQLKVLANEHLSFFISHIEKCAENDELLHILREKHGAMFKLRILLGGKSNMKNLWDMPKVRSKLHNQNFFANKMRLVEHYKNFLLLDDDSASAAEVQLHERFAADVFVWSSWVEAERSRQCLAVQKMLDELFFHFRIFYDAYKITSEVQKAICTLRSTIPALKKLLNENRNKMLSQNEFLKEWGKLIKIVKKHIEENLPQNDVIKKDKESIEFIQKLHFIEFMKLLNGEYEDGRLKEAFAIILNDLTLNKVHQQKLSAFLTENDLKQILEKVEIESSIFVEKKEKQNFNIENNGKIVSEKTEKNRRKKEKNKMKIAEKKADIKIDSSTKVEQIQGNAKRNEIVEENEETNHFERNESPPKENSNEKMCNNCEEKSGKLILQQDIVKYMEKKDQFKHNLSEEFAKIGSFKVFYNNAFLCGKYEEFMTKPCTEMQLVIIDVGAYINEIGHRLKMIDEMEKFAYFQNSLNKKRAEQMANELQEFMLRIGQTDVDEMVQKMNQILMNLLNIENSFELKTQNAKQMQRIKRQIHLKNLSMALLWSSAFGKQWANYENKIKKEKLYYLLGERFGAERFDKVKLEWKNMVQQIELDGELYDKYITKNKQTNFIDATFPILSQQINLSDDNDNDNLESFLEEMIRNNIPEDQQITEELNKIRSIVEEWSNGIARLYISGSFLLGTRTIGSDIDLLCLVPGKIIKPIHFFDAENIFCKENECSTGATNCLYCQLCKNKNVKSLVKTPFGSVFLIKFEFNGIHFDLTFVAIPGRRTLPQLLDDELMAKYISSFKHNKSFAHKRMLRALSSYRSTLYIANLFQENCVSSVNSLLANRGDVVQKRNKLENKKSKSFRTIILFLKIWAINNHIYSTAYGYLNGSTLAIMVAKIILLYPTSSLPFLLEKFFVFYLTRPIRVPVQLNKLRLEENLSADENPDPFFVRKPDEQEMPVYMPMFPEQNVAQSVTHCAVRIIRNEMINAFNKINVMNAENLNKLLTSAIPFAEKFETFILVNCVSKQNDGGEHFSQFVAGRIRLQIVFDIDLKGNNKTETQLYNGIIYQKNCAFHQTLSKFSFSFRPNHCKFWLIGIRSDESKETLTNNLNKFDLKIKCDYLKYNYPTTENVKELCYGKEPSKIEEQCKRLGIDLESIIVSKEELSDNKITNEH